VARLQARHQHAHATSCTSTSTSSGRAITSLPTPCLHQDPDLSDADTNELMTSQFQALMAGLEDEVPAVRATAIAGTCTVLNLFWEMVPSATAALFMNKLTGARWLWWG
jgi:hypothetical protein